MREKERRDSERKRERKNTETNRSRLRQIDRYIVREKDRKTDSEKGRGKHIGKCKKDKRRQRVRKREAHTVKKRGIQRNRE